MQPDKGVDEAHVIYQEMRLAGSNKVQSQQSRSATDPGPGSHIGM